jgi:hypothetical protein
MRFAFVLATTLACVTIPAVCGADAAGKPHWSRVDFTESTHLGPMRVLITTTGKPQDRRIDRIRIWSNGHELRVPGGDALHVANPVLDEVSLGYTASYTCLDDNCPDIRTWPADLIIPFGEMIDWPGGERPVSNSCDQSFLAIDVLADRVSKVSINQCNPTGVGWEWLEIFVEK